MGLFCASRQAGRIVSPRRWKSDHLIIGWAEAEGLLDLELEWEGFREIIRKACYTDAENLRGAGNAGGHMWCFIRAMKTGDLVVVPHGSEFYVGEVTGPAFYDESKVSEDSAYRRPVKWLHGKRAIPRAWAKSALLSRMGIQAKHFQPEPLVGADVVRQLTHGIEEGPEGPRPDTPAGKSNAWNGDYFRELQP